MTGVDIHRVEDVSLFRGLSKDQMDWVGARLYSRRYPANSMIITAQQPGEVVYVILSGTVKIHVEQPSGVDVVLAILGAGDIVGEMSLIDSAGRSASVVTLEDSELLWMSGETFQESLHTIPLIAKNLVRILSSRVRLANELIQALATLDVHGRVARQLLAFAETYGQVDENGYVLILLRLTQRDIADLVGASRKRVNQAMVLFKNQDLIAVADQGRITVKDHKALARYCQ